jgi:hypothetical protein
LAIHRGESGGERFGEAKTVGAACTASTARLSSIRVSSMQEDGPGTFQKPSLLGSLGRNVKSVAGQDRLQRFQVAVNVTQDC